MRNFKKTAAQKLVKLYQEGKLGLDSVAKASAKLKNSPRFLQPIGRGAEGVADLSTFPNKHGIAVRKTHDLTSSLVNLETLKEKEKLQEQAKGLRYLPKFFGADKKDPRVHYSEYIKNTIPTGKRKEIDLGYAVGKARNALSAKLNQSIFDISPQNNVLFTKQGPKIIDFLTPSVINKMPYDSQILKEVKKANPQMKTKDIYNPTNINKELNLDFKKGDIEDEFLKNKSAFPTLKAIVSQQRKKIIPTRNEVRGNKIIPAPSVKPPKKTSSPGVFDEAEENFHILNERKVRSSQPKKN
jgi:hypothetical protein